MADVWRFGGREFAFDIYDADGVSRLGGAVRALKEGAEDAGGEREAVGSCVSRFFDVIFGEGASDLMFPETDENGADLRISACASFAEFVTERCRAAGEEIGKWEKKYLPQPRKATGR